MNIKNKRGQSTVEYILLVTAVVAVMIAFSTGNNSILPSTLNSAWSSASNSIGVESNQLASSYALSNAVFNGTPPYSVPVAP
jgi:Flp pilus assembly pilin Flp